MFFPCVQVSLPHFDAQFLSLHQKIVISNQNVCDGKLNKLIVSEVHARYSFCLPPHSPSPPSTLPHSFSISLHLLPLHLLPLYTPPLILHLPPPLMSARGDHSRIGTGQSEAHAGAIGGEEPEVQWDEAALRGLEWRESTHSLSLSVYCGTPLSWNKDTSLNKDSNKRGHLSK